MKVLFIGGNSHISKSILAENLFNEIFIISRNKNNILKFCNSNNVRTRLNFINFKNIKEEVFDLIINFASPGYPEDIKSIKDKIVLFTKEINNKVIEYLKYNKNTKYIFISSGIVNRNIKTGNKHYFYYKSKVDIEKINLSHKNLLIYNLRIYSFISSYIDLKKTFFISSLINSIKKNKIVKINNNYFTRDYIGPKEIILFIKYILKNEIKKCSIDICSSKFVTKKDILDFLKKKYHLKYKFENNSKEDDLYIPTNSKKIFKLKISSIDIIKREVKKILI